MQPCMMPYTLQSVEFWRIPREIVYLYIYAMFGKPVPYISVPMVCCIVMNQKYLYWIITIYNSFEIRYICNCIEDRLKLVKKSCKIQLDCTENLQCISLPCCWYFRLRTYSRPSHVEGGILPETCFVFEEDRRPCGLGFFLILG